MVAKRVCAGLAAIAMVFTNTSIPVIFSESNIVITANAVTTSFTGLGDGTESNPYQITSASELMEIANNPSSFYVLNNDIDLSDFNGGFWDGIGDESCPFTGVFDGQNHTISNLNFDRINIGLFNATCGCSIKNLVLKTSSINISYSGGTVYDSENDYYDYDESLDTYSSKAGGYYVGCLIGIDFMSDQSENTVIDNCFVNADLNIKSTCRRSKTHYVGGLIGCVKGYEKELNLTNCTMEGKVSFYSVPTYSGSENYIGGFVGSTNTSIICNDVTVLSDISSSVNSTAINTYAGGISGSAGYFECSNCTINGDIVADCNDESWISDSSHGSYSGGLSGKASDYSVYNSHVKGKIYNNSDYGTGHAGGLFGQCNSGDIISCSYNGDISNYCTIEYSDAYAGGLCGEAVDITIDNFKTNNTIYNRGYYRGDIYTGGIVGKCSDFSINNYEVTTKLTPCAYDGAGASSYAGGLVGYASDVYLEETPVDVSIDNSSKGIHNYNSEELNNDYVGYAYNYSNSTPENSKAELSFTDVNSIIGESEWFFGNYTAQFASKIDSELSSIDLSYDESAMEITDVSYSKSGKKSAVISGTINAKKPGNHEVSVSLANSSIDVQTFLVNIEPELVLPGSTVGNMYNHYACMTVNCDGVEDVVTKDVTFNVSIDDANAEYLESFLNSIEVSTLETGDLTAHATYKTSYTIADDGKSAEFVVTVSCVNTDMTDYISVKTSAQEKVLQVTRNTNATHYRNFVIGRDSNSFLHTNNSEYKDAGFVGRTDHVFSSAEYYDELTKNSSFGEKIEIIKRMNEEWEGSCYGIALSIGLVNQNYIPIADITNTNASKYYDLNPTMSKDNKFSNMIEYYYLSQYLDKGGKSAVECQNFKNSNGLRDLVYGYSDLSTTLKHIVNKAYDQKPFILGFGYGTDSGHAVVALGCERVEGAYNIIVYDENSRDHINYSYFTINDDYSGFNCSGDNFNSSNYRYLKVIDMEAMKNTSVLSPEIKNIDNYKIAPINDDKTTILASSIKMLMSSETIMSDSEMKNDSDNVNISFYGDASFRLINSNGEVLTYKDGVFSGEIKVLSISSYLCNDKPFYTIAIKPEDEYVFERIGAKIDIEVSDTNNYYAIQSDKLERFTLNVNSGLKLDGNNFDFTAQVGVNKSIPTLLSVSGTSERGLMVDTTEEDVVFSSEGEFDNIVVTSYVDVEKFENEYGAINSDFKVNSSDATITACNYGDLNNDNKIDSKDILLMKKKLAGYEVADLNKEACDVNGDGKVTSVDAVLLLKYVAGYDVELGK